jgi:hypothetical protein
LEGLRVKALDHFLGGCPLGEFDERKATWTAGLPVHGHHDVRWFGDGCEVGAEVGLACPVGKVPDEETDCQSSL